MRGGVSGDILLNMKASKEYILAALDAADHTPNRALGQNFCIDGARLSSCVTRLGLNGEPVVEIGPGFGVLTAVLANNAEKVVSIELDKRLQPVLCETLAGYDNISFIWV